MDTEKTARVATVISNAAEKTCKVIFASGMIMGGIWVVSSAVKDHSYRKLQADANKKNARNLASKLTNIK